MLFHISFEAYDSIISEADVARAQDQAGQVFATFSSNPKIKASGHFVSKRGGFLFMEADSAEEIAQLLGPLLDIGNACIEPCISFDQLVEFFKQGKQARGG